jgi:hypothetical protein
MRLQTGGSKMSEFKGMTRYGRRARLVAMVVSAVLALPGLAIANHTTCDKQSNEVGAGINCPEFSPGIEATVSNPVIDSESTLSYEYSQADHESSTMLIEAYAPKHWQFNTQIRPSLVADACSGSAEAISGNSWRLRSLAGTNRAATERTGAAYFASYNAGTETITACARFSGGPNLPFTISRLPATHPYAATHDWKITISTRGFVESIKSVQGSMTRLVFDLNQRTSGTWHQNLSGGFERAIFSRASHTPVRTDLRADATSCRRGMSDAPADAATGCLGNATISATVSTPEFNISPAPTGAPLEFSLLTGPNRIPGTTAERVGPTPRQGFGLVNGGNTATVTWTQPPANPDETVKGYALVIAIPGNQGSQSGQYLLKAGICGPTGTSPQCARTLTAGSLPRLDGNGSLHPDVDAGGKYDLALITIWNSGKRSDGRCDDGTWQGALCAPTTPLWRVNGTFPSGNGLVVRAGYPDGGGFGTSRWQFLWRTHAYPNVSVETTSQSNGSGSGDNETEPFMLLFVDYTIKEAEFVIYGGWTINRQSVLEPRFIAAGNAADGPATSFKSRDNRIIGDGKIGSVQFSNNASPTGTARRFDYVGETDPSGTFGLVSILEPGDIALGSSVPPNPTSSRPMYAAIEFMEGGSI